MASQSHNFCQMNKLLPPLNPFLFTQFLSKRRFYCIFKRFSPSPLQKHKFDSSSFPERLHGSLWQFGSPKIDRFGNFCGNYARERPMPGPRRKRGLLIPLFNKQTTNKQTITKVIVSSNNLIRRLSVGYHLLIRHP